MSTSGEVGDRHAHRKFICDMILVLDLGNNASNYAKRGYGSQVDFFVGLA